MLHKMWPLLLAILSASLAISSVSSDNVSDTEVNNFLAIGINDETLPFIELYDAKTDNWKVLRTTNFDITDYGVVLFMNRLLLIGGVNKSDGNLTNEVNEVDLLSGQIKTVDNMYMIEPRSNPSLVIDDRRDPTLYMLGGRLQSGAVTATVHLWDESREMWVDFGRPMLSPCEGAAAVFHKNDIYVMGGFNGDRYINVVQHFNNSNGLWTAKYPMFSGARGHFHSVSDGRYIYAVGGFSNHSDPNSGLNRVSRYDSEIDRWDELANISHCSGNVGVNILNGQLYAVGGSYCVRTQIYHENNNTWEYLAPLTYDRSSHTVVKVPFDLKDYDFNWTPGNRSMKDILIIGASYLTRKIEVYHPEDGSWLEMEHEETNTSSYQAAFVNDRLIIAGGYNATYKPTNQVFEISLETGKVFKLASMWSPISDQTFVTLGEGKSARLYAIGGYAGDAGGYFSNVYSWDPFTDEWEYAPSLNLQRSSTAAVQHKGAIYIFGGYNRAGSLNQSEVFFPHRSRWEYIAPMIYKTDSSSAVSDGKYIYVVGGRFANHVQRYDPFKNTWEILASTTTMGTLGISLLDNAPVVFGGIDLDESPTDFVEIYDAEKDEWRKLTSMNYNRIIKSALQVPWKWKY